MARRKRPRIPVARPPKPADQLFDDDGYSGNPFRQSSLIRQIRKLQLDGKDLSSLTGQGAHQHLVPRFILEQFAVPVDRATRVFQLDTTDGATARPSVRGAAARTHFYSLEDEAGQRHTALEGYLSLIDDHSAVALRRLNANPRALSDGDRATLSLMLATLEHRSVGGNKRIQEFVHRQMQMFVSMRVADEHAFHEQLERLWGRSVTREEAREFGESVQRALSDGDVNFHDPRAVAHQIAFQGLYEHAVSIFVMSWTILEASGFVTSDRGLAMFDAAPPFLWSGNAILSSPKAETTIPLSPTTCLLLRNEWNEQLNMESVDDVRVNEINMRTYGWADRFVYGPAEEPLKALRAHAEAAPETVPHPVVGREVLLMPVDPDDPSFAKANHAAGREAYIVGVEGDWSDYIVVDDDVDPVEAAAIVARTSQERVAKAMERNPELAKNRGSGRFRTFVDPERHVHWQWIPEADDPAP